ncbi:hypothetical protein C6P46_005724, partial [Rhodotorula mucilaginosa]
AVGVALCCVVFWVGGKIGLDKVIDWASDKWADGYSMPNWPSQDLFDTESIIALQAARPILQGDGAYIPPSTARLLTVATQDDNPDFTRLATGRIFSVPLARIFLAMSALVCERRDALVNEAADIAYTASKTYAKGTTQYDLEMTRAENKLSESEERIKREAAKWGLAFDGVTDLSYEPQLDLGSLCSHLLYADRTRPEALYRPLLQRYLSPFSFLSSPPLSAELPTDSFAILNRAGTTPVQYSEWLVDASISKTGAGVWYGPVQAAPPLTKRRVVGPATADLDPPQ